MWAAPPARGVTLRRLTRCCCPGQDRRSRRERCRLRVRAGRCDQEPGRRANLGALALVGRRLIVCRQPDVSVLPLTASCTSRLYGLVAGPALTVRQLLLSTS